MTTIQRYVVVYYAEGGIKPAFVKPQKQITFQILFIKGNTL